MVLFEDLLPQFLDLGLVGLVGRITRVVDGQHGEVQERLGQFLQRRLGFLQVANVGKNPAFAGSEFCVACSQATASEAARISSVPSTASLLR